MGQTIQDGMVIGTACRNLALRAVISNLPLRGVIHSN